MAQVGIVVRAGAETHDGLGRAVNARRRVHDGHQVITLRAISWK
jgi:hypothetical protein